MIQQHLLILTLGPVQSFIAEARRTADLYAGSKMLVELTRTIVQTINRAGGELIYPASDDLKNADMPNKLVAIVDDPQQVTDETHNAMLEKWREFVAEAFKEINGELNFTLNNQKAIEVNNTDTGLAEIIKRQLNYHLEFYWVAAAYDGTDEGYQEAYKKADRALGARKQSRDFAQAIETGFKDSLSGSRSALRAEGDKDARVYWGRMQKLHSYKLQPGELLDTLGVIKRFGTFDQKDQNDKFPSTSTVAAASFARACAKEGLLTDLRYIIEQFNRRVAQNGFEFQDLDQAQIEKMCRQQNKGCFYCVGDWGRGFEYDGDLLYPETYTPQNLANRYNISQEQYNKYKTDIDQIIHALAQLYDRADKEAINPGRPSPYYAILQMDGDLMGKHVSQCNGKEDHQQLSRDLDKFTKQAAKLVTKHYGYLIYAGGDDVLAMFPFDTALTAANELAVAYQHQFAAWEQQDEDRPFPFTASAGIAFAHHLYPLDGALAAARQAEKRAKHQHRRNALSVTVLRRSGETSEMGGKWADEFWLGEPAPNTVEMVANLIKLLEAHKISTRFPSSVLRDAEVVTIINDQSARKSILRQLLKRHRAEKLPDDELEPLIKKWVAWANAHDKWTPLHKETNCPPDNKEIEDTFNQGFAELARWFGLARWLATGGQE